MATVSTPLVDRAANVFSDLGYTVRREGRELRAERKWRVVQVAPADEELPTPRERFQCLVTRAEHAETLRERLAAESPDCEWAVLGITDDGDHEIHRGAEGPTLT
jgi:hypothetical protein